MIPKRRVMITGAGAITALGNSIDSTFQSILDEKVRFSHSRYLPKVPVHAVDTFDLKSFIGRCKNKRYLNRGGMFSLAAVSMAITHAKLPIEFCRESGLFVGGGPHFDFEAEFHQPGQQSIDWQRMPALWMLKFLPNTTTSVISQHFGINGESQTLQTACTASLNAIGEAFRKIRDGYLDSAICGGGDSRLSHYALMAYEKAGALAHSPTNPDKAGRPFDQTRKGFVPGEGGAFLVLESLDQAKMRGAPIIGEVLGFGTSLDGHAMTAPRPDGKFARQAIEGALKDAELSEESIDLISTHGTGTQLNDAMEAELIRNTFRKKPPLIMALKSWLGHLSAACGCAETALALKILNSGTVPAIRNLDTPLNDKLRWIRTPIYQKVRTVLIENFGFGGQNSALIISKAKG